MMNYGDGQTQSYGFDALGNRLQRQDSAGATNSTFNAANMLLTAGGSSYTNDADGDTLTGGGRTMAWDGQNRMTSCTANGTTTTYTYGADGLRRSATRNGQTTLYVYDGQTLIRELNGAKAVTATYLCGPRGPEYRRDDTRTEADGQGHAFGVTRWYVYDGLGSVVGEVDPLGNLTANTGYDVYGAKRVSGGAASSRQGFVGGLGHVTDDTGLVYMRARYYDPGTGRFASQDPGYSGSNWYMYGDNNPTNFIDEDGKDADLVSTIGSADISATLDAIAGKSGIQLMGDVIDMSGVLNADAAYVVRGLEIAKNIEADSDWGYYAKGIAEGAEDAEQAGGTFFKAWVRYNYEESLYDYSIDSPDLFEGHPTPSIGTATPQG